MKSKAHLPTSLRNIATTMLATALLATSTTAAATPIDLEKLEPTSTTARIGKEYIKSADDPNPSNPPVKMLMLDQELAFLYEPSETECTPLSRSCSKIRFHKDTTFSITGIAAPNDARSGCPEKLHECFYQIRTEFGTEGYVNIFLFDQFSSPMMAEIYESPRLLQIKPKSPDKRWKEEYEAYLKWVKTKGVGVGFSKEQVLNASGEPNGKSTTIRGKDTLEIWAYDNGGVIFRNGFSIQVTSH